MIAHELTTTSLALLLSKQLDSLFMSVFMLNMKRLLQILFLKWIRKTLSLLHELNLNFLDSLVLGGFILTLYCNKITVVMRSEISIRSKTTIIFTSLFYSSVCYHYIQMCSFAKSEYAKTRVGFLRETLKVRTSVDKHFPLASQVIFKSEPGLKYISNTLN